MGRSIVFQWCRTVLVAGSVLFLLTGCVMGSSVGSPLGRPHPGLRPAPAIPQPVSLRREDPLITKSSVVQTEGIVRSVTRIVIENEPPVGTRSSRAGALAGVVDAGLNKTVGQIWLREEGQIIEVELDTGELITVTQAGIGMGITEGARVRVTEGAGGAYVRALDPDEQYPIEAIDAGATAAPALE